MYPKSADSHFDHAYYTAVHIPLLQERWADAGLQSVQVVRGISGLDGSGPTFEMTVLITFSSLDDLKAALQAHGAEIMADVPRFTDIKAILQFNEAT